MKKIITGLLIFTWSFGLLAHRGRRVVVVNQCCRGHHSYYRNHNSFTKGVEVGSGGVISTTLGLLTTTVALNTDEENISLEEMEENIDAKLREAEELENDLLCELDEDYNDDDDNEN